MGPKALSKVIIVESPSKAKNLSQYLKGYVVLASGGHVRDLPAKQGSVNPENFSFTWQVIDKAQKALEAIKKAAKDTEVLVLATDLDREGEAIAWHILQCLQESGTLKSSVIVQRVVFNAVTKETVLEALKHPREIDQSLVQAYLARLGLDYLVGFTLSPILWRKLPGSRSAGRVQSVALRIVVEREEEILKFKSQEYWTLRGLFEISDLKKNVQAQLVVFQGNKLDKFAITGQDQALEWKAFLETLQFHISKIEQKPVQRQPAPPFITATLQQEASYRLGFSPAQTMQVAQKLYEGIDIQGEIKGLITYMRTDSLYLVPEFVTQARSYIQNRFGDQYLVPKARSYKTQKHSQEAHEAIRPTDLSLSLEDLQRILEPNQWRLYKLIWDRALASQMANALYQQTSLTFLGSDNKTILRASGSVLKFDGFLVLYEEAQDEDQEKEENSALPAGLEEGQKALLQEVTPHQHFTQPPGRFSEASLVKKLEELGIGRPGTWARILQVLQERGYVRKEKKRLIPEELGFVVTAFLKKFFAQYVDQSFTSHMEQELDQISEGQLEWTQVLQEFWTSFKQAVDSAKDLRIAEVLEAIEEEILSVYVPDRTCPKCSEGVLGLRLGKAGPFVGCNRYPECSYISGLQTLGGEDNVLGVHPESGNAVELKNGPFGPYVACDGKRVSIAALEPGSEVTLPKALWLLGLPWNLGQGPEGDIVLGIGRFGPYVQYEGKFYSVKKKGQDLVDFSLQEALDLIQQSQEKQAKGEGRRFSKSGTKTSDSDTEASKKPAAKKAVRKTAVRKTAVTTKRTKAPKKTS